MACSSTWEDVAPRRPRLIEVNANLTCMLCRGYLVDATTIVECLHSFCRSCIIQHLNVKCYCPICEMMINIAKPNIKPDKALQDIVYKMVPGLFEQEMERRRVFYENHPEAAALASPEQRGEDMERLIFSPDDKISLSLELIIGTEFETLSSCSSDSGTDSLTSPTCGKRYLECPAKIKIFHLKKFLIHKYEIDTIKHNVNVLYKRVSLPDFYTLMDIAYIYTWKRNEPMRFFYNFVENMIPSIDTFEIFKSSNMKQTKVQVHTADKPNMKDDDVDLTNCETGPVIQITEHFANDAMREGFSPFEKCDEHDDDSVLNNDVEMSFTNVSEEVTLKPSCLDGPITQNEAEESDLEKSQFLESIQLTARKSCSPQKADINVELKTHETIQNSDKVSDAKLSVSTSPKKPNSMKSPGTSPKKADQFVKCDPKYKGSPKKSEVYENVNKVKGLQTSPSLVKKTSNGHKICDSLNTSHSNKLINHDSKINSSQTVSKSGHTIYDAKSNVLQKTSPMKHEAKHTISNENVVQSFNKKSNNSPSPKKTNSPKLKVTCKASPKKSDQSLSNKKISQLSEQLGKISRDMKTNPSQKSDMYSLGLMSNNANKEFKIKNINAEMKKNTTDASSEVLRTSNAVPVTRVENIATISSVSSKVNCTITGSNMASKNNSTVAESNNKINNIIPNTLSKSNATVTESKTISNNNPSAGPIGSKAISKSNTNTALVVSKIMHKNSAICTPTINTTVGSDAMSKSNTIVSEPNTTVMSDPPLTGPNVSKSNSTPKSVAAASSDTVFKNNTSDTVSKATTKINTTVTGSDVISKSNNSNTDFKVGTKSNTAVTVPSIIVNESKSITTVNETKSNNQNTESENKVINKTNDLSASLEKREDAEPVTNLNKLLRHSRQLMAHISEGITNGSFDKLEPSPKENKTDKRAVSHILQSCLTSKPVQPQKHAPQAFYDSQLTKNGKRKSCTTNKQTVKKRKLNNTEQQEQGECGTKLNKLLPINAKTTKLKNMLPNPKNGSSQFNLSNSPNKLENVLSDMYKSKIENNLENQNLSKIDKTLALKEEGRNLSLEFGTNTLKSLIDSGCFNLPSSLSISLTESKDSVSILKRSVSLNEMTLTEIKPDSCGPTDSKKPKTSVNNYIEILKLPDATSTNSDSSSSLKDAEQKGPGPVPNLKPIDPKAPKTSANTPQTFQQTFLQSLQQIDAARFLAKSTKGSTGKADDESSNSSALLKSPAASTSKMQNKSATNKSAQKRPKNDTALDLSSPGGQTRSPENGQLSTKVPQARIPSLNLSPQTALQIPTLFNRARASSLTSSSSSPSPPCEFTHPSPTTSMTPYKQVSKMPSLSNNGLNEMSLTSTLAMPTLTQQALLFQQIKMSQLGIMAAAASQTTFSTAMVHFVKSLQAQNKSQSSTKTPNNGTVFPPKTKQ